MSRRKSRIPVFINKKKNNNEKEEGLEFSGSYDIVLILPLY
jgi:hypothetical protein